MPDSLRRRPKFSRRIMNWVFKPKWLSPWQSRLAERAVRVVSRIPRFKVTISRLAIKYYAEATPPRPQPFSLQNDKYTSWASLTDRSYSSRHLAAETEMRQTPSLEQLDALFQRSEFQASTDTSVAFAFFAQWFTDSFLRTDRACPRKNTSNHCIDLCQIYGLTPVQTDQLRAKEGGRLKSWKTEAGDEFPPLLLVPGTETPKKQFDKVYNDAELKQILATCTDPEKRNHLFAVGLERGNATLGHAVFTTLFLREHNRIARLLEAEYQEFDDDQLFETTRNIMIVLLLKLVIEEYIKHIGAWNIPLEIPQFVADKAHWNRQNWISIEFNLLYRWHSLVPDTITRTGGKPLAVEQLVSDNKLVMDTGIATLLGDWSRQRAGRIGLFNSADFFFSKKIPGMPAIIPETNRLMRSVKLRSYNDYREEFGLPRLGSIEELTRNSNVRLRLNQLYDNDIDQVEWFVGIFAEDYPRDYIMGELMLVMVAHDAFTQALTSPLLAEEIWGEETFTPLGLRIIEDTTVRRGAGILQQILARNSRTDNAFASFKC